MPTSMKPPEKKVTSWEALTELLAKLPRPLTDRAYVFRGQPDDWPLYPKLARALPKPMAPSTALKHELTLENSFMNQAHLFLPASMVSKPEDFLYYRWALMQHYGAPTRLLDWTFSPYVALYIDIPQMAAHIQGISISSQRWRWCVLARSRN